MFQGGNDLKQLCNWQVSHHDVKENLKFKKGNFNVILTIMTIYDKRLKIRTSFLNRYPH